MAEPIAAIRAGLARTKHEPDGNSDEEHAMTGRTQSLKLVAAVPAAGDAGELTRCRAVVTKGMVSGADRIVEVPNLPTDLNTVSRDHLVFASGSIHIVSTNMDFSVFVNPSSRVPTVTIQQTGEFIGDIGQFAPATGRFTGTVTGPVVL